MPTVFPMVGHRLMEPLAQLRHFAGGGPLAADASRNGRVWKEVRGVPVARYTLTAEDIARLKRGLDLSMQMLIAAGARRLYPGVMGVGSGGRFWCGRGSSFPMAPRSSSIICRRRTPPAMPASKIRSTLTAGSS